MTTMATTAITEQYEALRAAVLAQHLDTDRRGLALLRRRGWRHGRPRGRRAPRHPRSAPSSIASGRSPSRPPSWRCSPRWLCQPCRSSRHDRGSSEGHCQPPQARRVPLRAPVDAAPGASRTPRAPSASTRCASAPSRSAGRSSTSSSSTATSAQSGASATDREGFQRLVAEVGMGRAGIVLGLEVSRLARNTTDWHRLLEICALADTLILDEDGVYDPAQLQRSAAARAQGHDERGRAARPQRPPARRHPQQGAPRRAALPAAGRLRLRRPRARRARPRRAGPGEPAALLRDLRRTGAARATVKTLRDEKVLLPRRLRTGAHKGELVWAPLEHWRALQILHNPRYAGAFFFGRLRSRKLADGTTKVEALPRDEWLTLLPDAHAGYISWEEYETNQRRLREQAQARGHDRRRSPPAKGQRSCRASCCAASVGLA